MRNKQTNKLPMNNIQLQMGKHLDMKFDTSKLLEESFETAHFNF